MLWACSTVPCGSLGVPCVSHGVPCGSPRVCMYSVSRSTYCVRHGVLTVTSSELMMMNTELIPAVHTNPISRPLSWTYDLAWSHFNLSRAVRHCRNNQAMIPQDRPIMIIKSHRSHPNLKTSIRQQLFFDVMHQLRLFLVVFL